MVNTTTLELWGGVECTVNRVNDQYMDQLALNGHASREEDLQRFAQLGFTALRFPILWERNYCRDATARWEWSDHRLAALRELELRPIGGLLHHGSGPLDTSLISRDFAIRLAEYAGHVARRYPWINMYTPVNEPLTTARFSGLYGFWYPHEQNSRSFARALVNQCRGTILAMQAIRAVNPGAQLVQTEDLSKVFSTPTLAYQAAFENERRWVTYDLITGRLSRHHVMWQFLLENGIEEDELLWFQRHSFSDVILGCNYYITSERLLDERIDRYPHCAHGGNGRHRYADVEAVRARLEGVYGLEPLLLEVWDRYQLPIAVTEVHLGCHRESQILWLLDAWQAAQNARAAGADVQALTAWSLLGSFDWDSLLTRAAGHYESGVYDARTSPPRETRLADVARSLSRGELFCHPSLPDKGWWQREDRLIFPPVETESRRGDHVVPKCVRRTSRRRILIAGGAGRLGSTFSRLCRERGIAYATMTRARLDITNSQSIEAAIRCYRPWAIVNAAGYTRVDSAEANIDQCRRVNAFGPSLLASYTAGEDVQLLTFSSELVFNGEGAAPYLETDETQPLCVYGQCKEEADNKVLAADPQALVVRAGAFFGPWDEQGFLGNSLSKLAAGIHVYAPIDWTISPTYLPDLVHTCLDLLIDREAGLWHLANAGCISWARLIERVAALRGISTTSLRTCAGTELGLRAKRPIFSALGSQRGQLLPTVDEGIWKYSRECSRAEALSLKAC